MKTNPYLKLMLVPTVSCSLLLVGGCNAAPIQSEQSVIEPVIEPKLRAGEVSLTGNIVSVNITRKSLQIAAFSFTLASGKTGLIEVAKKKTVNIGAQTVLQIRSNPKKGELPAKIALSGIKPGDVAIITGPDSGTGKPLNARLIQVLPKLQP